MKQAKGHEAAIFILALIIIIQWAYIANLKKPVKPVKPVKKPVAAAPKGKIAIVIDDWGYNLHNLGVLDLIGQPLTLSILPNLNYSREVAEEAHRKGFEIILHLPMEPHEKFRLEKNTIMVSMDETKIKGILDTDLESIRYAKGVSNHMGSGATEDVKTMTILLKELKKRHIYFLDSLVSSKSVVSDLAKKAGVRVFKRDVFLDNKEDYAYIKGQIYQLKAKARHYGKAVGIGHDRKLTLQVLKDMMPEMVKEGYKFVFVSELID